MNPNEGDNEGDLSPPKIQRTQPEEEEKPTQQDSPTQHSSMETETHPTTSTSTETNTHDMNRVMYTIRFNPIGGGGLVKLEKLIVFNKASVDESVNNVKILLGRHLLTSNNSDQKKVSRDQIEVNVSRKGEDCAVELVRKGKNPTYLVEKGEEQKEMEFEKPYLVKSGDTFSLFLEKYWYRFNVQESNGKEGRNYKFYSNLVPSVPNGEFIDRMHTLWFNRYDLLERHHGYIQWIFPLFLDSGMNGLAERLTKCEAYLMRNDIKIAKRVINSYRMMLNFYGMQLVDEMSGEIARHSNPKLWSERYDNLNWSGHNYLRISRILTSLGELGFNRYKKPLVDFLTKEVENGSLKNCRRSLEEYWTKLCEPDTLWYFQQTVEEEEDREESIFFSRVENKNENENENSDDVD